ncbi:MAG: helix-turn-helix domain-containing protein [Cyanobacteria bacterium SIG26]|nr:helix-turn-helix domain-containing protein [Cyanobacteria bacterium SIG26]
MNKQEQLLKFGTVLKSRRQALKLSLRDVESLSNVSAALITKLENGKMANFPKAITIKQLSQALRFNDELFILANILFETQIPEQTQKSLEDELREFLATKTTLTPKNIEQALYFISGLEKLQQIDSLD